MGLGQSAYKFVIGSMLNHPTRTTGGLIFTLGFVLVAGNAIFSQPQAHPDPLWNTASNTSFVPDEMTDQTVTESVIHSASSIPQPRTITHSVLTQRISLKNLPVPTERPPLQAKPGAQPETVREFQELLAVLGLYDGKVDGIYGGGTKSAIIAYQESAKILPDGKASYELLANLRATVSASQRIQAAAQRKQQEQIQKAASIAPPVKKADYNVKHVKAASTDFDQQTVRRIQAGLKEKFGIEQIDVDGVFGSQTREALKQFQAFFQLNASGEIDKPTLEKLVSSGIITAI